MAIPQTVQRRPERTPAGMLFHGGGLGPAAAAASIRYPIMRNPSTPTLDTYPMKVEQVTVLPGLAIAQNAGNATTFALQTAGGTVIATGTNAGAGGITVASGLNLTINSANATVAAGTALHAVITNVVSGEVLSATHVVFQVRLQPA